MRRKDVRKDEGRPVVPDGGLEIGELTLERRAPVAGQNSS